MATVFASIGATCPAVLTLYFQGVGPLSSCTDAFGINMNAREGHDGLQPMSIIGILS